MYCKNCGNEINQNMKFCPECGTKFEETTDITELKIETNKNEQESVNVSTTVNENNSSTQSTNSIYKNIIGKKPKRPFMRFLGSILIPLSFVFLALSGVYLSTMGSYMYEVKASYYSDISDKDWKIIYEGKSKSVDTEEYATAYKLNNEYKENRNPGLYSRLIDHISVGDPFKYKSFDEFYRAAKNEIADQVEEKYSFMNIYICSLLGVGLFIAGIVCKSAYKEGQRFN